MPLEYLEYSPSVDVPNLDCDKVKRANGCDAPIVATECDATKSGGYDFIGDLQSLCTRSRVLSAGSASSQ